MTRSDDWERVQELFLRASEVPAEQVEAFLAEAGEGDAGLIEEVRSLLDADASGSAVLERSLDELVLLLDEASPAAVEDGSEVRVGPYRLLEEIGRGGMGVVYRAELSDAGYEREVALKVVRRSLGDPDSARRFARECRILAELEHPNIARLYDAGVTDDGDPYLAMELVDGHSIGHHCDAERLNVEQRLRLFEQVCHAVDFAHQRLVIHRDLKPSNILVESTGTVKLLDFGIARFLAEGEGDRGADLTRAHQRLLTPEYASPEQLDGDSLSTASDVFSLGVVLHELLTGAPPRRDADGAPTTLPSTGVPHSDTTAAEARSTTPGALRTALRGEVDAILLKAMASDRDVRYPTASALLDDLQRYRRRLPIAARPPSASYRARKFVQRHRWPVAAAASFVMLLGASSVTLAVQQAHTARERDRAEREAAKAQAVTDFLLDVLASSDPGQTRGEDVSVRDVLDRAAEDLGTGLAGEPEVRFEMHRVIGEVYRALGVLDPSRTVLLQGLALRDQLDADEGAALARLLTELGNVEENLGLFEEAERHLVEALELRRADGDDSELSASYLSLGLLYTNMGRLDEAEPLLREAVALDRAAMVGDTSGALAYSLNNLAVLRYTQGEFPEATELLEESLVIRRQMYGRTHPRTATTVNNLAAILTITGDYAAAEPLQREALAIQRELFDGDHPDISNALHNLGTNLASQGLLDEAEELTREALAMNERVRGDEHPEIVSNLNALAQIARDRGELERARELLARALEMSDGVNGPDHVATGVVVQSLGIVDLTAEEWTAAESHFRDAVTRFTRAVGSEHFRTAGARIGLARALLGQGRTAEAEPLYAQAIPILEAVVAEDDEDLARARSELEGIRAETGA